MNNATIKKMVLNGLMIALVFLTTCVTRFQGPVPQGYINFGDIFIMTAAILLGKNSGFIAGSFGSALADIVMGYPVFAPVTFIVKGLEGYITGAIAHNSYVKQHINSAKLIVAVITGALVMVAGYFFAELYVLKLVDNTFGYAAAMAELPANLVQGGVSAAAGYVLVGVLSRVNSIKHILR
jgi:uncharacterized membrane protein